MIAALVIGIIIVTPCCGSGRWSVHCTCLVVGTCRDKVNDFECFCATGYTGRMCTEQINECASNPCLNGGSCEDLVGRFQCHCTEEREGDRCQYRLGESPAVVTRRTTLPATTTTPSPSKAATEDDDSKRPGTAAIKSSDDGKTIVFTKTQLILVVCFGSGIPLCLLLLFVSILLYRRWKKKTDAKSEEARQNEANNMNNRIHNNTSSFREHGKKKCDDSYPTEKSINDMEIPSQYQQQLQMSYRNSAISAPFPDKLAHKDYIKNVNAVNDRHASRVTDSLSSIGTADNLKLYGCQQQQQLYDSRSNTTPYSTISTRSSRDGAVVQPTELTYSSCSRPTKQQNRSCDHVSANTISTISSAAMHTSPADPATCDSSYRSQSLSSHADTNISCHSINSSTSVLGGGGANSSSGSSCVSGYVTNR